MKVLDLFAGTQSLRKTLGAGYDVTSVDCRIRSHPTICTDILTWDYRAAFKPGHFDVVWASPPCTEYSKAKTVGARDIEGANRIVQKTLEIIKYLKPKSWFMENPQTGHLKYQEFMNGIPFHDVSYCKYGFSYKKQTRIWTNVKNFVGKICKSDCPAISINPETGYPIHDLAFAGPNKRGRFVYLHERYAVPPQLIKELFAATRASSAGR
jgi:hypothetical protein